MNAKTNTTHKHFIAKTINNWPEYNKSLKNRGNLSIFISESAIKNGRIIAPKKTHKTGRPFACSSDLIELILTIRVLFRLPLCQTTRFVEYPFGLMHLSGGLLDYTLKTFEHHQCSIQS